jgi:hypothetical protein
VADRLVAGDVRPVAGDDSVHPRKADVNPAVAEGEKVAGAEDDDRARRAV